MFSNTATPIYYEKFRNKVIRGDIVVCAEIAMEMKRIDELILNPGVFYDPEPVDAWIEFCETEMTLTDGSPVEVLESFKLWGEQVYGWYYYIDRSVYVPSIHHHGGHYERKRIKKRLVNKQYLIVGRGAAKTLYATFHQAYGLICDFETTEQLTTAPTMIQAEEVTTPFITAMSRAPGPVLGFLTEGSMQNTTGSKRNRPKLASTKKGVENLLTNSIIEIRPMSISKLQGRRDKYATVDEWLSGEVREDPISAIEQGASKNEDYLIIATSSEGTVRNGVGDTMKMELMSILKGDYYNPHVSIWWYKLDNIKEVSNPAMWIKANPNIGITVSYEAYQKDVERAEQVPAVRNDIIAKRFGIPMEGFTYFFTYQESIPHPKKEYWNMQCSLGADLSMGDDFCAFSFMFPLNYDEFGIKVRAYITERTLKLLHHAQRDKYEEFIEEGSLIVMDGTVLNMLQIYDDVAKYIEEQQYDVNCFGYDPYNAKEFVEHWIIDNGEYGLVKVPQGSRTESVPLGEIKDMAEDRRLLFDEKLMQFCIENCITIEDTNGNRKLYKARSRDKIDCVAATLDAYVAYKQNQEAF